MGLILSLLLFAANAGAETPIIVNPDSAPATAEETAAPVYAVITPEGNTPCRRILPKSRPPNPSRNGRIRIWSAWEKSGTANYSKKHGSESVHDAAL